MAHMTAAQTVSTSEASLVNPAEYTQLVQELVTKGDIYGKTKDVAAYPLLDLHLVTQNAAGQDEVSKTVEFKEKLMMVFDLAFWPTEYGRHLAVRDTAVYWAKRIIGEEDINHPDFKGPGMWTSKMSGFNFDYIKKPVENGQDDLYVPNPEGGRLCLTVAHDIKIPTGWGEAFLIPAGGTLAIREKDVPVLVDALRRIEAGADPESVLYKINDTGQKVAAIDIYGMMPEFLADNYDRKEGRPETIALLDGVRSRGVGVMSAGPLRSADRPGGQQFRAGEPGGAP